MCCSFPYLNRKTCIHKYEKMSMRERNFLAWLTHPARSAIGSSRLFVGLIETNATKTTHRFPYNCSLNPQKSVLPITHAHRDWLVCPTVAHRQVYSETKRFVRCEESCRSLVVVVQWINHCSVASSSSCGAGWCRVSLCVQQASGTTKHKHGPVGGATRPLDGPEAANSTRIRTLARRSNSQGLV